MTEAPANGLLVRWRLVVAALADQRLAKGDCAALAAILDRCNERGEAWPSLGTVAKDAGVSRATAIRSVGRLVDLGYLVRQSGNRTTSNRYRIGSAGSRMDEPRLADEPRLTDETGVGAPVIPGVGARMSLEPTQLNQPNEPAQGAPASLATPERRSAKKKAKAKAINFQEWLDTSSEEEQDAAAERVDAYIAKIGAPEEYGDLFMRWAYDTWTADPKKVQASWPRTIDNYLRNAWHRLWAPSRDGGFYLTTAGEQLRCLIAAEEGRPINPTNTRRRELL